MSKIICVSLTEIKREFLLKFSIESSSSSIQSKTACDVLRIPLIRRFKSIEDYCVKGLEKRLSFHKQFNQIKYPFYQLFRFVRSAVLFLPLFINILRGIIFSLSLSLYFFSIKTKPKSKNHFNRNKI